MTRSNIPPYVFLRRFESEKRKHPFSADVVGRKNPYTEDAVSSEAEYYDYLRIHTYFLLCDELVAKQTQEIRETAQNDITWLRNQNEYLKGALSNEEKKRHRLRIVSIVLLILLLLSLVFIFSRRSARTYDQGYAAGRSVQESADADLYGDGYAAGKDAGYNEGYRKGYWEGYADAGERSTGAGDSSGSRSSTHTGTGSTRDTAIANTYIGNTSSKKFHLPTCSYLPDAANQITFDSRDEAIAAGYDPCGHCKP